MYKITQTKISQHSVPSTYSISTIIKFSLKNIIIRLLSIILFFAFSSVNAYSIEHLHDDGQYANGGNRLTSTEVCTNIKNSRPAHCQSMFGNSMFWPHSLDPSAFWNIPVATNGCGTGSTLEWALGKYGAARL